MARSYSREQGYKFPPIAITYSPAKTYITRFPRAFTRYLDRKLPKQIHLRNLYDNDWTVITREFKSHVYILEGWPGFIADNFVKPGDVVKFRYHEDSLFDVKIFDLDGCETEGAGRGLIRSDKKETDSDEYGYSTEEETCEDNVVQPIQRRTNGSFPSRSFRIGKI